MCHQHISARFSTELLFTSERKMLLHFIALNDDYEHSWAPKMLHGWWNLPLTHFMTQSTCCSVIVHEIFYTKARDNMEDGSTKQVPESAEIYKLTNPEQRTIQAYKQICHRIKGGQRDCSL